MIMNKWKLIREFVKEHTGLITLTFVAGLCNSTLNLFIPVFTGKYYQLAFHTHSPRGKFLDSVLYLPHLSDFFLWFSILVGLKAVFTFSEKYLTGYSSEVFSKQLREQLFSTQLLFSYSAFEKKAPGKYLLRYSGDLSAIQRFVMKGILRFSIDVIFLALAFTLLGLLNLTMTLIVAAAFLFFFLVVYFLNFYLKKITIRRRNLRSELLSFVSSRLHGLATVKIFNREPVEEKKFGTSSERLLRQGQKYFRMYGIISALFPLFLYGILCFIFYYAHQLRVMDKKSFPAHEMIIYIMVLINLLPVLRRIMEVTLVWQAGNVSINKILRIFNSPIENKYNSTDARFESSAIELKGISFSYPNGKKVFEDLSFSFPANSINRIAGEQGKGKSTLYRLLLGLYPLNKGTIIMNGKEQNMEDVYTLRKNITLVSDEVPLIGKTIFEAISYSRKEDKREKAQEILEKLQFSIDGVHLADLDYPLQQAGQNLSTGQRKVLQLARAFLTRKKVILLDEPFNGLDVQTEHRIVELLNDLRRKRTILVVSTNLPKDLIIDQTLQL